MSHTAIDEHTPPLDEPGSIDYLVIEFPAGGDGELHHRRSASAAGLVGGAVRLVGARRTEGQLVATGGIPIETISSSIDAESDEKQGA